MTFQIKKMTVKFSLSFLFSGLSILTCSAQLVDVDTYTGKAIVTIPIWTIHSGSLSFPISLVHVGGGVKADTPIGLVGTSWEITSGGFISRQIRGLPDDYNTAAIGSTPAKQGWLTNSVSSIIGGFVPAADENLSIATDEQADYDFLNSLGGFNGATIKDTEPDIFFINTPSIACSFVYSNNGQIAFLGKQDFKVSSTLGTDGLILGFTVIDDKGVTYTFGSPLKGSIQSVLTDAHNVVHNESEITHFKYNYYIYNAKVTYNATWRLLSIQSSNGDKILFDYDLSPRPSTITAGGAEYLLFANQKDEMNAYLYDEATGSTIKKFQYTIVRSVIPTVQFTKAIGKTETATIVYSTVLLPSGDYQLKEQLVGSVEIYDTKQSQPILERRFRFGYGVVENSTSNIFLRSVTESSSIRALPPYLFEYNGVDFLTNSMISSGRNNWNKDQFGFDNSGVGIYKSFIYPELNGIDRIKNNPIPGYTGILVEVGMREKHNTAQWRQ
jgi:hypothetical protein